MIEFSHHILFFVFLLNLPHDPRTVVPQVTFLTPEADNDESGFFFFYTHAVVVNGKSTIWGIYGEYVGFWFWISKSKVHGENGEIQRTYRNSMMDDGEQHLSYAHISIDILYLYAFIYTYL